MTEPALSLGHDQLIHGLVCGLIVGVAQRDGDWFGDVNSCEESVQVDCLAGAETGAFMRDGLHAADWALLDGGVAEHDPLHPWVVVGELFGPPFCGV